MRGISVKDVKNARSLSCVQSVYHWFKVSVITCAAPNLRTIPSNEMNPGEGNDDQCGHELHDIQKIRPIFPKR